MAFLDGKYEIDAEIGQGVSGSVFQARDNETSRLVVIKRLDPNGPKAKDPHYISEWDKIVSLDHPAVVQAYEHSEEGGEFYLVSEFVRGESLQAHLTNKGKLTQQECANVFSDLAEGLAHAHEKGLLHLNLKPQNVMLVEDAEGMKGRVCDFGLWSLGIDPGSQGNALAFYKAPEQRRGTGINPTSDVYALGKLLYVAVSGEMSGRITPDALPPGSPLQELIYRCIRTNSEDRFQSMRELADAIAAVAQKLIAAPGPQLTAAEPMLDPQMGAGPVPVPVEPAGGPAPIPVSAMSPMGLSVSDVSATGQLRASSEVQSLILACKNHLTNRRLTTCRELLKEAQELIQEYSSLQGDEWVASTYELVNEMDQELGKREAELRELADAAQEAFSAARYEDVQMHAMAAREISIEQTGTEHLEQESAQHLANINIFWEEAHRAMRYRNYKKADIACVKILDLNPEHVDAANMRKDIQSIQRRQKLTKFLIKASPIVVIILAIAGTFGYFFQKKASLTTEFRKKKAAKLGEEAEAVALELKNRHPILAKMSGPAAEDVLSYLEGREKAKKQIDDLSGARKRISREWTLDEKYGVPWQQAELLRTEVMDSHTKGESAIVLEKGTQATTLYEDIYLNYAKATAKTAIEKEEWQTAHEWLQKALGVRADDEAEKLRTSVLGYLVPELIVETTVEGKKVSGATIIVNGDVVKALSPTRVPCKIGTNYQVTVILAPRDFTYYKPAQQDVRFDKKEAKTVTLDLPVIDGPEPKKEWVVEKYGIKLRPVAAGEFQMGSKGGKIWERPVHKVRISKSFWISEHEITKAQFKQLSLERAPKDGDEKLPITNISWSEARGFCTALTRKERMQNRIPLGYEYRLPTEAEWEYVARAGNGDIADVSEYAWNSDNSEGQIKEICTKTANDWGVYDMLGNVGEWCLDGYNSAVYSSRRDPTDPVMLSSRTTARVIRGGHVVSAASETLPHVRGKLGQAKRHKYIGFRVVLAPMERFLKRK